jgi:hypothetical protein
VRPARAKRTISQSTTAPDTKRMDVNVAASIVVCVNAMRHSTELPAKAIIVTRVRKAVRINEVFGHIK